MRLGHTESTPRDACAQRRDHVRTQLEGAVCRSRNEISGGTNPANTLTLNFQPPELQEINFYCSSPQSAVLCYGSPGKLTHICIHTQTRTLLRCNPRVTKFTLLKYTDQWCLVCSRSCLWAILLILEHLHHLKMHPFFKVRWMRSSYFPLIFHIAFLTNFKNEE